MTGKEFFYSAAGIMGATALVLSLVVSNHSSPKLPVRLIADGKCLTTYDPVRQAFNACSPSRPSPDTVETVLPAGTTTLEVFQDPSKYVGE